MAQNRILVLIAFLLMFNSSRAAAAEDIDCMHGALSSEAEIELGKLLLTIQHDRSSVDDRFRELTQIIVGRARECAVVKNWSAEAAQIATMYSGSIAMAASLNENSPLTRPEMQDLKRHYFERDHEKLAAIADRMADPILAGQPPPQNDGDGRYLALTVGKIGIPETTENAEYMGQWLATQRLIERVRDQFASTS